MLQSGPVMLVEDKQGTYLGLVRAYRIDGRDRRGFLDLRLSLGQDGPTAETILATLDYLFTFVNLRKVYIESASISEPLFQWLERAGFAEEARLRQYIWRGRDYSDLVYYGLDGDVWLERRKNLENSLLISAAIKQQPSAAQ
jgi:RimJ/RimL family protein N-acetyltransferase